jgi:hypothetical protein
MTPQDKQEIKNVLELYKKDNNQELERAKSSKALLPITVKYCEMMKNKIENALKLLDK